MDFNVFRFPSGDCPSSGLRYGYEFGLRWRKCRALLPNRKTQKRAGHYLPPLGYLSSYNWRLCECLDVWSIKNIRWLFIKFN